MNISNSLISVLLEKDIAKNKIDIQNDVIKYFERNDECVKSISMKEFMEKLIHWLFTIDKNTKIENTLMNGIYRGVFKNKDYFLPTHLELLLTMGKVEIKERKKAQRELLGATK